MVYVAGGNPGFATDSILVSDETTGQMIAYSVDGNGDILAGPAPLFATLDGASGDRWGGTSDPLTGDVMVLASDHVAEFRGFAVPEPTGLAAAGAVLALVGARRGRRRRQS